MSNSRMKSLLCKHLDSVITTTSTICVVALTIVIANSSMLTITNTTLNANSVKPIVTKQSNDSKTVVNVLNDISKESSYFYYYKKVADIENKAKPLNTGLDNKLKNIIKEKEIKKEKEESLKKKQEEQRRLQDLQRQQMQEQQLMQMQTLEQNSNVTELPMQTNPDVSKNNTTTTVSSTTYSLSDISREDLIKSCYKNYNIKIRDFEINELIRMVEAEAGDQDIVGRELVANTILNRCKHPEFTGSVHDVLFAPKQYSPILDGRYWTVTPSQKSKQAVINVLNGIDKSQGAIYFMQPEISSARGRAYIEKQQFLFKHGCHSFYK